MDLQKVADVKNKVEGKAKGEKKAKKEKAPKVLDAFAKQIAEINEKFKADRKKLIVRVYDPEEKKWHDGKPYAVSTRSESVRVVVAIQKGEKKSTVHWIVDRKENEKGWKLEAAEAKAEKAEKVSDKKGSYKVNKKKK